MRCEIRRRRVEHAARRRRLGATVARRGSPPKADDAPLRRRRIAASPAPHAFNVVASSLRPRQRRRRWRPGASKRGRTATDPATAQRGSGGALAAIRRANARATAVVVAVAAAARHSAVDRKPLVFSSRVHAVRATVAGDAGMRGRAGRPRATRVRLPRSDRRDVVARAVRDASAVAGGVRGGGKSSRTFAQIGLCGAKRGASRRRRRRARTDARNAFGNASPRCAQRDARARKKNRDALKAAPDIAFSVLEKFSCDARCAIVARRRRRRRRFPAGAADAAPENFLPELLTVRKSVIRFRPADVSCGRE